MRTAALMAITALLVGATATAQDPCVSPAASGGQVLLTHSGEGAQNTAPFEAPGMWWVDWTYDCSQFGMQGNFSAFAMSQEGAIVAAIANALGESGGDRSYVYTGGPVYLQIISVCEWTVTAAA